jgi:hypothetical protein
MRKRAPERGICRPNCDGSGEAGSENHDPALIKAGKIGSEESHRHYQGDREDETSRPGVDGTSGEANTEANDQGPDNPPVQPCFGHTGKGISTAA